MTSPYVRCLPALAFGAIGGALATQLGIPLPWLLGAMLGCIIPAILGLPLYIPSLISSPVRPVIGIMLGLGFTPELLQKLSELGVSLLFLPIYVIVLASACSAYLRKFGKLDPTTAYFSAVPGGLTDMAIIGADMGGDARVISLMHAARVTIVIFTVPWIATQLPASDVVVAQTSQALAHSNVDLQEALMLVVAALLGAQLARRIGIPAPLVLGPVFLTAVLSLTGLVDAILPEQLTNFAQYILGSSLGSRFSGTHPRLVGRILILSIGQVLISLALTVILCVTLVLILENDFIANLLAFAPGGFAEMSLMALTLGHDVGWVTTHHSLRIFIVIFTAAFMMRWLAPRKVTSE